MDVLPSNEVEFPDPVINKTKHEGNIILICLGPNDQAEDLKKRLHQINSSIVFHTDLQSCITFIQLIEQEQKIFLITSQIFSHIPVYHQIDNIFIFCPRNDQYELLPLKDSKIIGMYDTLDSLCISIKEQINLAEKRTHKWCSFDQVEYETKDLSKQSNDFLWLQLFHAVILHLPCDQQVKRQKINAHRQYYQSIPTDLTLIDDFNDEYQPNEAIHWFMKNSSCRKMINRALQTEDINKLYRLRYFLSDLRENIRHEHQRTNEGKLIVYREMQLSNDEFKQLQESKGKLISMKIFFTATTKRSLPMAPTKSTNLISVLFEIECNFQELNDNFIFANITQLTNQETYLFDFNATFQLETIQQNEHIWIVKLNAVNDGQTITQKYIYDTRRQFEDLSISIIFGKLICDMSQWNQSQQYFEQLLNDSHDEDLAWIEHSIGQTHHWKGEWNEARKYYDRAYERMIQAEPSRIKDSAAVLSDIGEILHSQGKYEAAFDYHCRALTIRKKYYSSHHAHVATSLENIGLIFQKRLEHDEAFVFFQRALIIREEYYNYFHVDIAMSSTSIACHLTHRKRYGEALVSYERAMAIYKKYYPLDHVDIATTLCNIGDVFYRQDKWDEGLNIIHQALVIQKKFYPSGHIDIATSLIEIGNIKHSQEKYDESLEFYHQALTMLLMYYSSDHIDVAFLFDNIGEAQLHGKENCDEALRFHQQALTILETYYPSYLAQIAITLCYVGTVFTKQEKNDEALDLYRRALKMQEDFYLSDDIEMASILRNILEGEEKDDEVVLLHEQVLGLQKENGGAFGLVNTACSLLQIGGILHKQNKYNEALDFYQRSLTIREKFEPSNHVNIAFILMKMGNIKYSQREFDEALDYYHRAVVILEEFYPTDYSQISYGLEWIGYIWSHKRSYDRTIEYYEKCLKIREANLSTEHSSIVDTLSKLGRAQRNHNQYQNSITYELKCFVMREKVLPPDHQDIGESLANLGKCYEYLNQRKLALDYYKRALVVYEQSSSSVNQSQSIIESKIKQLSEEIEQIHNVQLFSFFLNL